MFLPCMRADKDGKADRRQTRTRAGSMPARSKIAPGTPPETGRTRHDRSYWALNAGRWLLEHFQRIKNSFYLALAGRRNF